MDTLCLAPSRSVTPCSRAPRDVKPPPEIAETVVTLVWMEEYVQLEALYGDADNRSPKLRYPDLISGCVSVVFSVADPSSRIFDFLHSTLVLRDQLTERRRENLWREQYLLLRALQMSEMNSHPHPQFKLDHFTTACVALALAEPDGKVQVFDQARQNIARRAAVLHRQRMAPSAPR